MLISIEVMVLRKYGSSVSGMYNSYYSNHFRFKGKINCLVAMSVDRVPFLLLVSGHLKFFWKSRQEPRQKLSSIVYLFKAIIVSISVMQLSRSSVQFQELNKHAVVSLSFHTEPAALR